MRNVFRLAQAADRMQSNGMLPRGGHVAIAHHQASSFDRTWREGVHPNAIAGMIQGHRSCHLDQRALCGAVKCSPRGTDATEL